jgi:hypothetical protein
MQTADSLAIGNRRGNGTVNVSGGVVAATGNAESNIFIGRGADTSPGAGGTNVLRITGGTATVVATGSLLMDVNDVVQSATLIAEITGAQHTPIIVSGNADVTNGALKVELSGYTPVANDSWTLVQAGVELDAVLDQIDAQVAAAGYDPLSHATAALLGEVAGPFDSVDVSAAPLPPGLAWDVSYSAEQIVLSVIPSGVSGDFDGNGLLDAADIDLLSAEVRSGGLNLDFDLNTDGAVNGTDREVWVNQLKRTYMGDANLDGEFSSSDFVLVFQAGRYEDGEPLNASWATGDWNGDGDFDSSDFVTAFQSGGFEIGPRPAVQAVPEPTGLGILCGLLCACTAFDRRRQNRRLCQ